MTRRTPWIVLLLALAGIASLRAEPKQVLLICDPVQQSFVQEAAKEIKGGAQVTVAANLRAYHSGAVLEQLDEILGDKKWDLIYFNIGIGDLVHRDPRSRDFRLMNRDAGGIRTPIEQYGKNLDQITKRLKLTGAKLLWGSTTPLINVDFFPTFEGRLFEPNSELEYNRAAEAIMRRHQVPVVDFHAHIMGNFGKDENHPPYTGYAKAMKDKGKPLPQLLLGHTQ
jgi:hypothetical protein